MILKETKKRKPEPLNLMSLILVLKELEAKYDDNFRAKILFSC